MIVKNGIVIYDNNVTLDAEKAEGKDFIDTTTRLDNATYYPDVELPIPFYGGWYTYDGTDFELTEFGLDKYKMYLINQMKYFADKKEYGSILYDEHIIKTTLMSQQYINGMYNSVQLNPTATINYICADGTWLELDKDDVEALSTAVLNHVEACFNRRKALHTDIIACTDLSEVQAVEANLFTGWPNNPNVEG